MSLFNTMRTATSGMSAQSNALSTIGDNIANSGTTGYKEANAQFETALGASIPGEYESGGVLTDVRYGVAAQGTLTNSTSTTDLAVSGAGFFNVSKGGQGEYLTRAGSFVPDTNGNLVNAAGYQLMGLPMNADGTYGTSLTPVNVQPTGPGQQISTKANLGVNLPSTDTAVTGDTPASNATDATYSEKTSMTLYDSQGKANVLDVYMTKTGDNTWEATAYPQSDAAPGGGFPYANNGTADTPVGVSILTFDANGKLTATTDNNSPANPTKPANSLNVTLASGAKAVPIDLSSTTQVASGFAVSTNTTDGHPPSKLSSVAIGQDGIVNAVYSSGAQVPIFKIPLATVVSPDNLTPLTGNVYQANAQSGVINQADPNTPGVGTINAGELENSTVDLATELTNMIVAQRAYEANSKVLQTGSDLLGELNRITTN